jgi:hypothetical protein
MSPSLLRSRCAHAFRIHWQANALPEERFKAAAAPLAQVIRRWFTGSAQNSKSVFHLIQTAQNAAYSKGSSLTYTRASAQLLTLNPERMSLVGQETFDVSHLNRVRIPVSSLRLALVTLLESHSHLAPKGFSTIINHQPYRQ